MKKKLLKTLLILIIAAMQQSKAQDMPHTMPNKQKVQFILSSYLNTLGTKENIMKIKNITISQECTINNRTYQIEKYYSLPNKYAKTLSYNKEVFCKYILNDGKLTKESMEEIDEEADSTLNFLHYESTPFPEAELLPRFFELHYDTVKMVGKRKVHIICAKLPKTNLKYYLLYEAKTFAKLKTIEVNMALSDTIVHVTEYSDWQEVYNVRFPYTCTLVQAGAITTEVIKNIIINEKTNPKIFTLSKKPKTKENKKNKTKQSKGKKDIKLNTPNRSKLSKKKKIEEEETD